MPRLALFAPLLFFATLLLACGGDDDSDGSTSNGTTAPTISGEATPSPTAAADKPTQEAAPVGITDEPVRFETSDGVTIAGHLYSSGGPKRKVVVLAHEFPKDQTAWTGFANQLAAAGIDALTFDFRGYGETGGDKDVSKIDLDLEYAARFIASRDYAKVYLFGASMGGTAAIKVAARLDLAGLVTLSAPDDFMGLDAREDIAAVTEPKLFIAARGDDGAPGAVDFFMQQASGPKDSTIYEGSEHGTDILRGPSGPDLETALFAFLDQY
jgi:alpha-beta hydrolase superfamily lysophospholipase